MTENQAEWVGRVTESLRIMSTDRESLHFPEGGMFGEFSHRCCDICESGPGDRAEVYDFKNGDMMEVCSDCVQWIANDELPDLD